MLAKLNRRMKSEGGFTLIELLIVLIIIGILVAIAVPSYLGFRDRAATNAAKSNVRAAVPAVETYFADHGNYNFNLPPAGTTAPVPPPATAIGWLRLYDAGLTGVSATNPHGIVVTSVSSGASYCISALGKTGEHWKKDGPGAEIASAAAAC